MSHHPTIRPIRDILIEILVKNEFDYCSNSSGTPRAIENQSNHSTRFDSAKTLLQQQGTDQFDDAGTHDDDDQKVNHKLAGSIQVGECGRGRLRLLVGRGVRTASLNILGKLFVALPDGGWGGGLRCGAVLRWVCGTVRCGAVTVRYECGGVGEWAVVV